MTKPFDLTGQKFGRWTILSRAENTLHGQAQWLCRCQCGNEGVRGSLVLRRGISRSCGCFHDEACISRSTKHGHANAGKITPTYHSWSGMLARCTNPKHRSYDRYGGRGITVCPEWSDFAAFLADMGEKPEGTSLERVENDGNYEPGNCVWGTPNQQGRNRRNNRLITFRGETRPQSEWCEILGIHQATLSDRLQRGWTDYEALNTPVSTRRRRVPD